MPWHWRILVRLVYYRIYRVRRRHRVVIDNESSDFLPVTPLKGSILGPLLFLPFINDMPNAISKETLLPLFANSWMQ